MKATGIVRRVDDLGRIVIPKTLTVTDGYLWAMEMLQKRLGGN